ncbi:MAG: glycosyl hydrolase [Lachnospiraceae bacterium]|nr:glycosyl hydrolase [Lachnospiraceae bacterium]
MKNRIVRSMLVYLMVSAIATTTVAGSAFAAPITVDAEQAESLQGTAGQAEGIPGQAEEIQIIQGTEGQTQDDQGKSGQTEGVSEPESVKGIWEEGFNTDAEGVQGVTESTENTLEDAEQAVTIQLRSQYAFDAGSDWDNNGGKENNLAITTETVPAADTTLTMDVLIPGDEAPAFKNIIKPVGVLRIGSNWNWVQSNTIPELRAEDFNQKITVDGESFYKASVSIEFGSRVGANGSNGWNGNMAFEEAVNDVVSAVTVQFAGYQCDYSGEIAIANAALTVAEDDTPEIEEKDPSVVATFDEGIEGWAGEAGWDYSNGKDDPVKNGTTPVEAADASWDETSQSLKMSLDYSKDGASGWSEAKITGHFDAVDVSNYNMVTFKLRYPSSMDTIRTKLFMASTEGNELINSEGSFRKKTVEDAGDGWSTVTIRGEFKPQQKSVSSLTIGIVGPYADLHEVYIDDVTFGQLDSSEDYVKITEPVQPEGDQAGLDHMATEVKLVDSNATDAAKALAAYLAGLQADDKVLFGHQNSTFRSVKDNGITSDVKDVTGTEVGLFGIDTLSLAGSECNSADPMGSSIAASMKAYAGGSIITLSCHMPNFTNAKITATGDPEHPYDFSTCDFMESKDLSPCADYILEGGEFNPQYNAYLDIIAEYALTLQAENIPILFRPFHENSGGWFWWGTSTNADSYRAIWRYMVNYLQSRGVHNLLYVYSPNGPIDSEAEYLSRFPGDAYVDVLAFDYYDDYADPEKYTGDAFFEALAKSCNVVAGLAREKNKIPAIAETGIRITGAGKDSLMVTDNPTKDKDWYNQVIETAVSEDIPYFLLWANFDSANFYIPYKISDTMGQEMINDFISAYNNDASIFGNGTNFYGENGAISRADQVTLSGYSDTMGGYLISPKNYAVIKEACELKASVQNAAKVEFVIKTSDEDENPVVLEAVKEAENSPVYLAQLTEEVLGTIQPTGTGSIAVVAYGAGDSEGIILGTAQFININQDVPVMPAKVFDTFEYYYGNSSLLQTKYGEHNSAAGSSTMLTLDPENKVEGNYGCDFNYTLAYKGSEAWTGGLGRAFDEKDFSEYNAISMWVKPDGNGQKMVIQLRDSEGRDYEVFLSDFVKGTEAQYVTIPFTSFIVKAGTDSIDPSDISGYYLWCNTIPGNIPDEKKDEKGNYTVSGTIVFDDIKAVKISDEDLAKLEGGKYITSDEQLEDLTEESQPDAPDPVATAEVTVTADKKNRVQVEGSVVQQIMEDAGSEEVIVTVHVQDTKGNEKAVFYFNTADSGDGNRLYIYQINENTGAYEMTDAMTVTVNANGDLAVTLLGNGTYELVSEAKAQEIDNEIKATVKLTVPSFVLGKGETAQLELSSELNMNNVKKITYDSTKNSVVNVNKNGKITGKKKGTANIKVTVQFVNGTEQTVMAEVTVE